MQQWEGITMEKKSLNKTVQCAKCPWKVGTNPYEIPNGYDEEKHKALARTCSSGIEHLGVGVLPVMSCHETHNDYCVGWLHNQLGNGNNIALRVKMMGYTPFKLVVIGKQHKVFADTLPTAKHLNDFINSKRKSNAENKKLVA